MQKRLFKTKIPQILLIAMVLVFSYEVNRPKAIAPLVLWGAGMVGSIVLEEAVEMGIKWGTKEIAKKKSDDIAKQIWNGGKNDLDFPMTKPKKNASGDVIITPSAKDRAKIAGKIADAFDDVIEEDTSRTTRDPSWVGYRDYGDAEDPFYNTSFGIVAGKVTDNAEAAKAYDLAKKMLNVKVSPFPFEKSSDLIVFSSVSNESYRVPIIDAPTTEEHYKIPGGNNTTYQLNFGHYEYSSTVKDFAIELRATNGHQYSYNYAKMPITAKAYEEYLRVLREYGTTVYMAQGFVVPPTVKNVYRYPDNAEMPADYQIPNKQYLENRPVVLKDLLPDSASVAGEVEIEWSEIENNYNNESEIINNIETNTYGTYLENGDINNTTYNTQVINNYYTDIDNETKVTDVEQDTSTWVVEDEDTTVTNPPATTTPGDDTDVTIIINDDDDVPMGDRPDAVEVIDRSMLDVARQTYDYLGDSVDTAIVSMRDVTDNATGLISYLDESFDWLPAEWRALFGSAFILGVFAHFFRR